MGSVSLMILLYLLRLNILPRCHQRSLYNFKLRFNPSIYVTLIRFNQTPSRLYRLIYFNKETLYTINTLKQLRAFLIQGIIISRGNPDPQYLTVRCPLNCLFGAI